MNKRLLTNLVLIALLTSCDYIYREYDKESFTSLYWKRGKEIIFYPSIKEISGPYELTLGIRHIYGAQLKRITVVMKIISPSGKQMLKEYSFDVVNSRGEYLASCAGDLCDLETVVDRNLIFSETGEYQVIITQAEQQSIRGLMEFGMILRKKN